MNDLSLAEKILAYVIPILFAITVHEVAHGWVAYKFGDPTAKVMGRLTLNPIKHIDLIGTIIVPIVLLFLGGFIFGWAKPVPITWSNLRNPKRDMAYVAIAGPAANLLMIVIWALIIKLGFAIETTYANMATLLVAMGEVGIAINLILMILNIIPIPPLDGSRVVSSLLPPQLALQYNQLEPYGFVILILLIASGLLTKLMFPILTSLQSWIMSFL